MDLPNKNVLPDSSPETTGAPIEVATPGDQTISPAPTPTPSDDTVTKVEPKKETERVVPLAALEQEREWRKDWERKYNDLKSTVPAPADPQVDIQYVVDPYTQASPDVTELTTKLAQLERKEAMRDLEMEYPQIKDKKKEFEEYLEDDEMKKLSVARAAKLFMAENGLLQSVTADRKGLEPARGGGHTAPNRNISSEEIKMIREKEPRKYIRMLREGVINPDDIK